MIKRLQLCLVLILGMISIDGFSQIPRYINEADDAGLKVVCEIKKTNL